MDAQEFEALRASYLDIVTRRVVPRLTYYQQRVDKRRLAARVSGVTILALSLIIPVVTNFLPGAIGMWSKLVISVMSLSIALVTGLKEFFRWEATWKEYSTRIVQIETLIAEWELKVAGCRHLQDSKDVDGKRNEATFALVRAVEQSVLTEMQAFFSRKGGEEADEDGGK